MNFKFGSCVPKDSPDVTPDKCFQKVGVVRSRDPVNFWVLNANSSKMAEDTNFKFGR